jgi:hypothetical protein
MMMLIFLMILYRFDGKFEMICENVRENDIDDNKMNGFLNLYVFSKKLIDFLSDFVLRYSVLV